jgi:hypothetical protein
MNEEDFKRLESKVDSLFTKIDEVNKKLEQAIVIPKYGNSLEPPKKKSKKEIEE